MNNLITIGRWKCYWAKVWFSNKEQADLSIHDVLEMINGFSVTLNDDKQSLVKKGTLFGVEVVAKNSRNMNNRFWPRFLSIFRQGEAKQTLDALSGFWDKSIPSVRPICALEKKTLGFVTDSWLIYEFKEGVAADVSRLQDIVFLLNALHRLSFRHDDPRFENFLVDEHGELFLIGCKGSPQRGSFSDYYDYFLLSELNEGVELEDVLLKAGLDNDTLGYHLARYCLLYKQKCSELKERILSYTS